MQDTFKALPDDLNATVLEENKEFEVIVLEVDEQWGFVGNKENDHWLWLVMHSKTRQVLAMHVEKRNKASAEALMTKLLSDLKKKQFFMQINSQLITKLSHGHNIVQSAKNLEKQITLKDLTARIRQRVARLVKKTRSFSKKIENHIGLIKIFICKYNDNLKSLLV